MELVIGSQTERSPGGGGGGIIWKAWESGVWGVKAWDRPVGSDGMHGCGRLMEVKGDAGSWTKGCHGTPWTFTQSLWGPGQRDGLTFVLLKVTPIHLKLASQCLDLFSPLSCGCPQGHLNVSWLLLLAQFQWLFQLVPFTSSMAVMDALLTSVFSGCCVSWCHSLLPAPSSVLFRSTHLPRTTRTPLSLRKPSVTPSPMAPLSVASAAPLTLALIRFWLS